MLLMPVSINNVYGGAGNKGTDVFDGDIQKAGPRFFGRPGNVGSYQNVARFEQWVVRTNWLG